MKNFLLQKKEFLLGLLLTTSLLWPLFWAPFFKHHDDVQIIRLYEMDKCIQDGQIPCRWVPDLGGLYGYPMFNYYAPLPYYFGELIYLVTGSLIFSVKVMFAVSFVGSYIFMYLFAAKFWGKMGGSLAAIFYSFAPYHGLDFYIRGAMGEMWALMLFPVILLTLTRLWEKQTILNLFLFCFSLAALITSHNLSTFIFAPVILIWTLVLYVKKKSIKFLILFGLAAALSIFLSSFYLFPMVLEKNLVHVDSTTFGYFGYTEHFKGLQELLIRRDWGYGSSIREVPGAEKEKISFQIGWVHLLGWALSIFVVFKLWKSEKITSFLIIVSSLIIAFSIFMVNPRSEFVWKSLDGVIRYLQFPWRFLLLIIFFVSFISGSFYLIFKNKKWQLTTYFLLILLVVSLNFTYFRPEKFINVIDKDLLTGERWDKQIKRSILDYLPVYAKEPPAELATAPYQILAGDTEIKNFYKGTNWISFEAKTKTHTIIRLSQYYFPDWRIFIDGKQVPPDYKSNSLGLMTIILGEGDHKITARLFDTPVRTISNFITLAAFLITVVLLLFQIKSIKKWILYYRKRVN